MWEKCLSCGNGKKLTINQTACVSGVENCLSYDDNGKCLKCSLTFVLTPNKSCKAEITDCTDYNNDGLCKICKNPKIPSMNQTACVTPILDCQSINDQNICSQCSNGKIQSFNKTACVHSIASCIKQSDDNLCLQCLFGTQPSSNQSICVQTNVPADQYNKTVQSKIIANSSDNNSAANTAFLSKDQNTSIDITNNYNSNYQIGLDKSYITFTSKDQNVQVPATTKPSRKTNTVSVLANLNSLPSSNYKVQIDVGFTKNKNRILQNETDNENLPDYFTVIYQPPQQFFVGTDKEIWAEIIKINEPSKKEMSQDSIFAIVFTIFGFLVVFSFMIDIYLKRIAEGKKGEIYIETIFTNDRKLEENQGVLFVTKRDPISKNSLPLIDFS